jgi:WD40 repeat protein
MATSRVALAWPERLDLQGDPLPAGAIARLGTIRLRPGSSGVCTAFSPDGKILATGEEKLRFWDVTSGKEIRCISMPTYVYDILSVEFSPDGKLFAVNGDNLYPISRPPWDQTTIYIGEVATGKILHSLKIDMVGVWVIRFSADSKHIAAFASRSLELHLWDATAGKLVRTFPDVASWSFSADRKSIALGQVDGRIALHDLVKDHEPRYFTGHSSGIHSLAFSPDGKQLASGGGQPREKSYAEKKPEEKREIDRTIRLWDVATGKERHKIEAGEHDVSDVRFSPDGRYLLANTSRGTDPRSAEHPTSPGTSLWDTSTGKRHEYLPEWENGKGTFDFCPDGKHLIRSARDGFHLWDIAAKKDVRHWATAQGWAAGFILSPDGTLLASGLHLWDLRTGKELHKAPGHRTGIGTLVFSQDGKRLASLDGGGSLYLWEPLTGKPVVEPAGDGKFTVLLATFSQDGRTLVAVGSNGEVRLWDSITGKNQSSFFINENIKRPAENIDDRRTYWLSGNPYFDYDGHGKLIFSRDGNSLAVATADHTIHLWDVTSGKELRQWKGQKDTISRLTFAPDSRTLAARIGGELTYLSELESGKEIMQFKGDVISFSNDGRLFAWADEHQFRRRQRGALNDLSLPLLPDPTETSAPEEKPAPPATKEFIHLWDLTAKKELRRWEVPNDFRIESLAFSGDGKILAAGGDELICLWDVNTGQERRRIGGPREDMSNVSLKTTPDGRILAHYSLDLKHGSVAAVALDTGRWIHILHPWSSEKLTFGPGDLSYAKGTQNLEIRALNTGKMLLESPQPHRGHTSTLAYSSDGQLLATGGTDGTILIWDMSPLTPKQMPKAYTFTSAELDDLWAKLPPSGESWDRHEAYHTLLGTPELTIPYLRECILRLPVPDDKQVAAWVAKLDSEDFEERAKARDELTRIGKLAAPALRSALARKPSAELRARAEELLGPDGGCGKLPPDWQRAAEGIRLLEQLNTAGARRALEQLRQAPAGSWVAREAAAALKRLGNADR